MTPTPKKRHYVTGVFEVSIHRGYDINDKTTLINAECVECGQSTGICYYSKTGKPRPDRKLKCKKCIKKAIDSIDMTHTTELTN